MDGKIIAGISITTLNTVFIVLLILLAKTTHAQKPKSFIVGIIIVLFILSLFNILMLFSSDDSSRPDRVLHMSLVPYYIVGLIVIIWGMLLVA